MNYLYFFIIIVILVFILIIINISTNNNNQELFNNNKYSCVCMFDLDDTITCNKEIAKNAINHCKKMNCKVGINTARQIPYIADIDLNYLGLTSDDLELFYLGPKIMTANNIAEQKVNALNDVYNKFNGIIPKNKIILFDDNFTNISTAKNYGYSIVHANNPTCGLNPYIIYQIDNILL